MDERTGFRTEPTPGMPTPPVNQDEEHLRILQIGFWIYAGLNGLATCCVGGYFTFFSAAFSLGSATDPKNGPPFILSGIFGVIGLILILLMGGLTYVHYLAGRAIQHRTNVNLVYVASAVACLNFPLGTALGVFAFVVLSRPSVKAMFSP